MRRDVALWMRFAGEDLRMARLALNDGMPGQACFHAQQCCEKLLKAMLVASDKLTPRTHKMPDLLSQFPPTVPTGLRERLLLLDRFYIPTRYPDALPGAAESGMPTHDDASEAIRTADECTAWVTGEMSA